MQRRILFIISAVSVLFLLLFMRLADLMIIDHDRMLKRARIQHTYDRKILVRRGNIYDRNGRELAVNLERLSLYADPQLIDSPEKAALTLRDHLKTDTSTIKNKLLEKKRFVWITRKVPPVTAERISSLGLKGVGLLPDTERFYPKGSTASHVLGFVDIDNRGLEGIEKAYEDHLASEGGSISVLRDAHGNILYTDGNYESLGNSVILTIDEGLQYILESEIDRAVKKWSAKAATAVMMDPHTGEILALANRPSFDPNNPGDYPPSVRRNRAVTDLYEPGSTIKVVMASAALEEGISTLYSRYDCSEGVIVVGGKRIRDIHKHGVMTLKEIIQKSSNVGAVKVALKLGPERFYRYIKRFGFGERTGIDLTGESPGIVKHPREWSGTTIAAMSIGYEIMSTPIQVLRAYAAVANGGYLVRPHLISRIVTPEGTVIESDETAYRERIISEKTAGLLRDAFRSVVSDDGTAPRASVEGNSVAGKTGTTKLIDPKTGEYSSRQFVSSFVGMVPADNPLFAIVVVLWNPEGKYYGGEVAAPVFREIAERALSYRFIPRDDGSNENILVMERSHGTKGKTPGYTSY